MDEKEIRQLLASKFVKYVKSHGLGDVVVEDEYIKFSFKRIYKHDSHGKKKNDGKGAKQHKKQSVKKFILFFHYASCSFLLVI